MGDSAGGGYALALARRLASEGRRPPLVLIAPWADATLSDPRTAEFDRADPWLDVARLRICGRLWAGTDDPARPEISPLLSDLGGLGPLLVLTGTRDVLHPQSLDLARKVRAAGGAVKLVVGAGLLHVYPLFRVPEGRRALDTIAVFLATAGDAGRGAGTPCSPT
jgi:acetyl esterase/lipase